MHQVILYSISAVKIKLYPNRVRSLPSLYELSFTQVYGCFQKYWYPPYHPLKNSVFHYFHHPFWGTTPRFLGKHPYQKCRNKNSFLPVIPGELAPTKWPESNSAARYGWLRQIATRPVSLSFGWFEPNRDEGREKNPRKGEMTGNNFQNPVEG